MLHSYKIGGDHLLIGPVEHTLHVSSRSLLHGGDDVFIFGRLRKAHRQVHNRDISRGHSEGHTCQLTVHRRVALAHSLGSAGGRRNDVLGGTAPTTPVLASTGRSVHCELPC